ncbi:LysR family transcriptional regulator [Vibrio algarum]|uniref:LysR family transcriptional regulator n=1 Tax=Vibrio algarum TaxID=3020714 RepID=A0ABT4YVZ3_9VIBR|nr:LysR family transcriptional regulator [Vibrio sp. KJ40-1]MDB1125754.1 LysR family transcriptional regulator [Vibrio sp. KJ40-1]
MDKIETMKTFLAVVKEGSFSKAAEKLDMSPQLVSKYVSALEDNLHTRLLHRTTRKVSTTEAGDNYYLRCQQVIEDIEEMENSLTNISQHVSGVLTVSAPMSFGAKHLPKLLVDFQAQYPEVKLELKLTDVKIDIVEEGVDVALRIGKLKSSSLIAKKVAPINIAIVASPDYLQRRGIPQSPQDLQNHIYLKYTYADTSLLFSRFDKNLIDLKLSSHIRANNGDLLVNAAIYGGGIAIQPTFIAGEALADGSLVRILKDYEPESIGLYMVYANRKFLPSKVRSFVDFVSKYYGDEPYWDQMV